MNDEAVVITGLTVLSSYLIHILVKCNGVTGSGCVEINVVTRYN